MQASDILDELTSLFRGVLNQPELRLNHNSTAKTVEGWDSLNHAILLAEVQKHFSVRFTVKEVIALKTVGELVDLVARKSTG